MRTLIAVLAFAGFVRVLDASFAAAARRLRSPVDRKTWTLAAALLAFPAAARAQTDAPKPPTPNGAQPVQVEPRVRDEAIAARLTRIYQATDWFREVRVTSDEGVVFIRGESASEAHRVWAAGVANNTEGVVAVVNQLSIPARSMWDFSDALKTIGGLVREGMRNSPLFLFAVLMLLASWLAAVGVARGMRAVYRHRFQNSLLRSVVVKMVASLIFLLGLYLVLRISGLTRLAATVLGGTGIVGLVLGFAFRDIAENFLASILLSLQRPFATGDLIQVAGFKGYVQSVNSRSSLLMTLEGNHVQIPNATVYKEPITNFSANPHLRSDFEVTIAYDASIARAQRIGLDLLQAHEAVRPEPEPLVLVENLGPLGITMRLLFWIDGRRHSEAKVKSALMRLTKRALQEAGLFVPPGLPAAPGGATAAPPAARPPAPVRSAKAGSEETPDAVAPSEGALESEEKEIRDQARSARQLEGSVNLLEN